MKSNSKIITLKEGLNPHTRFSFVFYIDYFVFRFILMILIGLTLILNTYVLFSLALIWQLIFMFIKLYRVYETKFMSFMAFLAECLILITILYAFVAFAK